MNTLPTAFRIQKHSDFALTFIDEASFVERLLDELDCAIRRSQQHWAELRQNPVAFIRIAFIAWVNKWKQWISAPHRIASCSTAFLVITSLGAALIIASPGATEVASHYDRQRADIVSFDTLPPANLRDDESGVGMGTQGKVGFSRGRGEGSDPQPKRSGGGGGGGDQEMSPAQRGKLPQPSNVPAVIPKFPPLKATALPLAGIDIDPALWKNLPMAVYGDPRSQSTRSSNGAGNSGGMGTGDSAGLGEGNGAGFGPGQDGGIGGGPKSPGGGNDGGANGNRPLDPDHVYAVRQTTGRVRILMKPEPQYTELARSNQIIGTVVLRAVFTRNGEVSNIRAVQSLPFGLTEKAIAAARQIKFLPATHNGRTVNVYMQLEYNFNLY